MPVLVYLKYARYALVIGFVLLFLFGSGIFMYSIYTDFAGDDTTRRGGGVAVDDTMPTADISFNGTSVENASALVYITKEHDHYWRFHQRVTDGDTVDDIYQETNITIIESSPDHYFAINSTVNGDMYPNPLNRQFDRDDNNIQLELVEIAPNISLTSRVSGTVTTELRTSSTSAEITIDPDGGRYDLCAVELDTGDGISASVSDIYTPDGRSIPFDHSGTLLKLTEPIRIQESQTASISIDLSVTEQNRSVTIGTRDCDWYPTTEGATKTHETPRTGEDIGSDDATITLTS